MTPQEKNYFEALYRDRNECANMLKKPSMRGINNSINESIFFMEIFFFT